MGVVVGVVGADGKVNVTSVGEKNRHQSVRRSATDQFGVGLVLYQSIHLKQIDLKLNQFRSVTPVTPVTPVLSNRPTIDWQSG